MQLETTERSSRVNQRLSFEQEYNPKSFNPNPDFMKENSLTGVIVTLCISTYYFGFSLAYLSSCSQPVLAPQFGKQILQGSVFGPLLALISFGAAIGVGICKISMNSFSRRKYLLILNVFNFFVMGLLQINDIYLLFIFRIFQGGLVGCYMILIPTYIRQLATHEHAGKFALLPQISVVLGVLTAYTLGVIYTDADLQAQILWRLQFAFPIIPTFIQTVLICTNYVPESPASILKFGDKEQAIFILSRFHGIDHVRKQVETMEKLVNRTTQKRIEDQSKLPYGGKALIIGITLAISQQWCGIVSVVTQAGHVISLEFSQYDTKIGRYTPIIITLAQLLGTFLSIAVLKKYQLKKSIIIGGFGLTLWLMFLGILFRYMTWAPSIYISFVMLNFYMITFGLTYGTVVWPYINLVLSKNVLVFASVLNWICGGFGIIAFEQSTSYFGSPYPVFLSFMAITFLITLLNTFLMVDVKNHTKQEVLRKLQ